MLPNPPEAAKLVGRVWRPGKGPCVAILRDGVLIDVTESVVSMADFLDNDPAGHFDTLTGEAVGTPDDLALDPTQMGYHADRPCLLAPCDFQALKACGVTFAQSMVERVIDERTSGDPARADQLRQRIGALIGDSLSNIEAGSEKAAEVKAALSAAPETVLDFAGHGLGGAVAALAAIDTVETLAPRQAPRVWMFGAPVFGSYDFLTPAAALIGPTTIRVNRRADFLPRLGFTFLTEGLGQAVSLLGRPRITDPEAHGLSGYAGLLSPRSLAGVM